MRCARADPKFVQTVPVAFNFERQQHLRVSVYDADEKASDVAKLDLQKQDHLGAVEIDLAEVVRGAGGAGVKRPLVGARAQGYLTIRAEERINFKRVLTVDIKGCRLARRDGCAAGSAASGAPLLPTRAECVHSAFRHVHQIRRHAGCRRTAVLSCIACVACAV